MQRGTRTDDPELPVRLSTEDLAERAETMAAKVKRISFLRDKKAKDAKSTQALIDDELDLLDALATTVQAAEEMRKQSELKFEEMPDQVKAREALAEVARLAECPKCGAAVGQITADTVTCSNGECPWAAKVVAPEATPAPAADRGPCPTCEGTGIVPEDHGNGAVEQLGCQDCQGTGGWLATKGAPAGALDQLREDLEADAADQDARRKAIGETDPEAEGAADEIKKRKAKRKKRLEQLGATEDEARA